MTLPVGVKPAKLNITIYQGQDYKDTWTFEGENLTGYTGKAQIRETNKANATLVDEFVVTVTSAMDSIITVEMENVKTSALTIENGFWDLELTNPEAKILKIFTGVVSVIPEITR